MMFTIPFQSPVLKKLWSSAEVHPADGLLEPEEKLYTENKDITPSEQQAYLRRIKKRFNVSNNSTVTQLVDAVLCELPPLAPHLVETVADRAFAGAIVCCLQILHRAIFSRTHRCMLGSTLKRTTEITLEERGVSEAFPEGEINK